jgi:hypothetical protein
VRCRHSSHVAPSNAVSCGHRAIIARCSDSGQKTAKATGGHDHPHAVRILARAWLGIIWKCWTTNTPYDPDRHGALQRLTKQDQLAAA